MDKFLSVFRREKKENRSDRGNRRVKERRKARKVLMGLKEYQSIV